MTQHDRHQGKTSLPRVWISDDVAQRLRELAWENDHPMVEEIRLAVRAHVKRSQRRLKGASNGRSSEAAHPGQGGGSATRESSTRDVRSAA